MKKRLSRVLLGSISLLVCLFLIFSWWVQTMVKMGELDKKFDAEKIIREVEIQSNSYTVRGLKNLFRIDQSQKISTITLSQGRTIYGKVNDTKILDTVTVDAWKNSDSKSPMAYGCRLSDTGDLIITRLFGEGG